MTSINRVKITNITDDPGTEYAVAIYNAENLEDLLRALQPYRQIAPDAWAIASAMTEDDWPEFSRGLTSERGKIFAGIPWMERYGAILLPEKMLAATMLANSMHVPWGLAFLRREGVR